MRDRLIELIANKICSRHRKDTCMTKWSGGCSECEGPWGFEIGDFADYLLEKGVIVPPCNVGDTVYVITEKHPCYACKWCGDWCHKDCTITDKTKLVVKEVKVFYFLFQEMHNKIQVEVGGTKHLQMHFLHFNVEDFGKTVFLTKEQAEKALTEVANGT